MRSSYLHTVKCLVPSDPVVLIDDSDVIKPDGKQFEALGIVRDGSESTQTKSVYKKRIPCNRSLCADCQQASCQYFLQDPLFCGEGLQICKYDHV